MGQTGSNCEKSMANTKKTLFALVALVATFFSAAQTSVVNASVTQSYNINKELSAEELRFDLVILKDALLKTHPGLFWHQPEKEFEAKYSKLQSDVNQPMTELAFYNLLTPFIGSIKCDHTNLEMSEAFSDVKRNTTKVFPLILKIIDARVYVHFNYSNDTTIQRGFEILSINGINADSIRRFVKPRSWADGFVESYGYLNVESAFTPLFLSFFHQPNFYSIKMKKPDGSITETKCEAVQYKLFRERYDKQLAIKLSPEHTHFSFSVIDSLSTGVLKINAFEGDGYFKFINSVFVTLKEKALQNLIIDLRGNGGGEGEYIGPLYRKISLHEYLETREVEMKIDNPEDTIFRYGQLPEGKEAFIKFYKKYIYRTADGRYLMKYGPMDDFQEKPFKPRKDRYTGNVYLLTDVQTSSGGSQLAVLAHYNKRARIIGRETGGGYLGNTSGWDFAVTLPNSKIIVHIPLIGTFNAVTGPEHRGVQPDYYIKEDINDLLLKKDSELLFTLDLIKKNPR